VRRAASGASAVTRRSIVTYWAKGPYSAARQPRPPVRTGRFRPCRWLRGTRATAQDGWTLARTESLLRPCNCGCVLWGRFGKAA
jgi:hypothetical protein